MRSTVKNGTAPTRGMEREPNQTVETVKPYYSTLPVIGGAAAGPVHGWEAIKPKPNNKPEYLAKAQQAENEAWENYLWLIDALEEAGKWDQGSVQDAWDVYEGAKRKAKAAYKHYCDGFDFEPLPF